MAPESLDMSLFFGAPAQKAQFSNALLRVLKTRGVAKIKNHGIPDNDISKLFSLTRRFFTLPLEQKMHAKRPLQANPNRGYSYVGQENVSNISGFEKGITAVKSIRDVKEAYDMGSPDDSMAPNRWPKNSELADFRPFMESFYTTAYQTELNILSALALALGISESTLHAIHSKAENEFRLLHYPAVHVSELRDGSATRIGEHTDFGTITMLFQDSTGGLQVEDQEHLGTFHDIGSTSPYEIILNIGDSLQRLTNDTFRAACHRVTYPPTIKADDEEIIPERYSVAYFVKVNRDASIFPFREFVDHGQPCKYADITAGEFNDLRIARLFGQKVK